MEFFLLIMIAVSLSMDAFSLSLAYGTLGMGRRQIYLLSFIVGCFHFVMPLLGMVVGNGLFSVIPVSPDFIVCAVLCVIGVQMMFESFKDDEDVKVMKLPGFFLFAFAVSVDSFSVGLTLTQISENYVISALVFALCSCLFTLFGLLLGNKIKKSVGKISTLFGGLVLIVLGVIFGCEV